MSVAEDQSQSVVGVEEKAGAAAGCDGVENAAAGDSDIGPGSEGEIARR